MRRLLNPSILQNSIQYIPPGVGITLMKIFLLNPRSPKEILNRKMS
jgi:hypothetical protein